jgi:clan AA aspartic protease (TIGR02281 family)
MINAIVTATRALVVLTMAGFLFGCAVGAQRQYLAIVSSNGQSQDCRALRSIAEERERDGIPAQAGESQDEVVRRCLESQTEGGSLRPSVATPVRTLSPSSAVEEVQIERRGNTYSVPVRINDVIALPFVLDTGATDLVIPADVALTLVRAGALTRDDFIGAKPYYLANGSEQIGERVIIREVKVGAHIVTNVTAIINPSASELLLGQSFLSKFGIVTLDYKRLVLVLSP